MSEINELKWSRIRHIIEKLKQQPRTLEQIFESLQKAELIRDDKIGKRSVQNYVAELRAIEIVSYDRSSGTYRFAENEKRIFESKHDYQIALTHSKNLLFSNERENTQRFDHTNPYLAIDSLAYESERDADDFATLQHLKTGYSEIYEILQKYRQLMDETGLSKRGCLPKLGGGIDFDDDKHFLEFDDGLPKRPSDKPIPATLPMAIDDEVIEFESGTLGRDYVIARVPASKVREILNLRDLLVGRIYGHIMNAVRNGTPLKGCCDFCPNREITIKGE
jgi:hypothetical protein